MNREECLKIITEALDKGERPDLRGADLSWADLRGADLSWADLRGADLGRADLRGVCLRNADLSRANLSRADLRGADLSDADLSRANLSDADLRGSCLGGADLRGSCLSGADLRGADLSWANLSDADLSWANLRDAIGASLALAMASHLPSHGPLTGWKKLAGGLIAELIIPASAKRSHGASRKCRASAAEVKAIYDLAGQRVTEGVSILSSNFVYRVGETVEPREPFCEDRWSDCASGIHFFITREEAENYEY
jgi:hypothetical protein